MPLKSAIVPDPNSSQQELIEFASTYNAYRRISDNPAILESIYQPFEERYQVERVLDYSLGIDFLRGWLFLLQRKDYFQGGSDWTNSDHGWLDSLWRELVYLIGVKSKGKVQIFK